MQQKLYVSYESIILCFENNFLRIFWSGYIIQTVITSLHSINLNSKTLKKFV